MADDINKLFTLLILLMLFNPYSTMSIQCAVEMMILQTAVPSHGPYLLSSDSDRRSFHALCLIDADHTLEAHSRKIEKPVSTLAYAYCSLK